MNFFEKMFKRQEVPKDETDKEAAEFIKTLEAKGVTDKDVVIEKIEGEDMTEKIDAGTPQKRSYAGGNKNT